MMLMRYTFSGIFKNVGGSFLESFNKEDTSAEELNISAFSLKSVTYSIFHFGDLGRNTKKFFILQKHVQT